MFIEVRELPPTSGSSTFVMSLKQGTNMLDYLVTLAPDEGTVFVTFLDVP